MEKTQKILLNSSLNKKSVNVNETLNIELSGNKKILPENSFNKKIDAYDVYLNERKNSNKFRLILNIYPICSNILFNPFTEIVRNEGSDDAICLNYSPGLSTAQLESDDYIGRKGAIKGKTTAIAPDFKWDSYEEVRDTQLSNIVCGFDYHCGIDIFNNHILRNITFKSINYSDKWSPVALGTLEQPYKVGYENVKVNGQATPHVYVNKDFNTIDDYMRDRNGVIVSESFPYLGPIRMINGNMPMMPMVVYPLHLYQDYDIYTFFEAIENRLLEEDGWFGFKNPSIISSMSLTDSADDEPVTTDLFEVSRDNYYACGSENTVSVDITAVTESQKTNYEMSDMSINRTINNRRYCEFIDMYPGRDLYSFSPKFNENRHRLEKNWNYCLTYPSENLIYQMHKPNSKYVLPFDFFRLDSKQNTSIKVFMFDEGVVDDNGLALVTFYTICQHGLKVGDYVNVYKGDDLFYESAEVVNIVDKYIYQIVKTEGNMSNEWVTLEYDDVKYNYNGKKYPVCPSRRCNVDNDAQDIHFRRVVSGVECKYYVRKFSRLPNFKFRDEEVNEYTLYDDNRQKYGRSRTGYSTVLPLIKRFSNPEDPVCDFENHIAKLGFANTSYGDDVTEIVYTDDIDVSYLRDNLGRPLSDIYFTVVKNNKGYKKWYGIGTEIDIKSQEVEYSHCFGKVNCSFLLSDFYRDYYYTEMANVRDVRDITAGGMANTKGLYTDRDDDEILFDKDFDYYGDICCYSPVDCDEQVIQNAMNRFNTVQREMAQYSDVKSYKYFNNGTLYYDEIKDVENKLRYNQSNMGDPYTMFETGSLNHSVKKEEHYMMEGRRLEGYYHQAHYRIPIKDVSQTVSSDEAIKYNLNVINKLDSTTNDRQLFEFKTVEDNNFVRNEKVVLYKFSTNEYFFLTVYLPLSSRVFQCVIADENGNHVDNINDMTDVENINDYVILKKHDTTPYYARLIKDGSCRYYWREIVANGIETQDNVYSFTNGAFYIKKQINFFLRRQDPYKNNPIFGDGFGEFDFAPNGELINEYYDFDTLKYYDSEEIEEC